MKLIVGLGNPGRDYAGTRHNIGFMAVDRLAEQLAVGPVVWKAKFHGQMLELHRGTEKIVLMKPLTYMNRSGQCVAEACAYFRSEPADDLMVILDDLALPPGFIRLRARGSTGSHNGLTSIENRLGTSEYPRLRIGIGRPDGPISQVDYVLGRFSPEQQEPVGSALDDAVRAVNLWLDEDLTTAMNRYNRRVSEPNSASDSDNESGDQDTTNNGTSQTK